MPPARPTLLRADETAVLLLLERAGGVRVTGYSRRRVEPPTLRCHGNSCVFAKVYANRFSMPVTSAF